MIHLPIISILKSMLNFLTDKPILKITSNLSIRYDNKYNNDVVLSVRIVNTGKRSCRIKRIYVLLSELHSPINFPIDLSGIEILPTELNIFDGDIIELKSDGDEFNKEIKILNNTKFLELDELGQGFVILTSDKRISFKFSIGKEMEKIILEGFPIK